MTQTVSVSPSVSREPAPRVKGVCHIMVALDIAQGVDLDEAEKLLAAAASRPGFRHDRRAPSYMTYQPPPLRITRACEPLQVGPFRSEAFVEGTLFDFGALSMVYRVPFEGPLSELPEVAVAIDERADLVHDAIARAERLVKELRPAIHRPQIASTIEDYAVFVLPQESAGGAQSFLENNGPLLARVLRGERATLSAQESAESLAARMSYGPSDLAVVDWNGALLFDDRPEDVLLALEFANIELLEMRHLDDRLDTALEESYATLSSRRWPNVLLPGGTRRELKHLAELRADGLILYEGVNNALKLLGDQYLARLYRLTTTRMGVPAWEASVLRKLEALESLYEKISDHHSNIRAEVLEWIIILLIAFEIVMAFVR